MKVQLIVPVGSDPLFAGKQQAWIDLSRRLGVEVSIPDANASSSDFDIDAMKQRLARVDLVVADLSFERPSCYYELGIVQTLRIQAALLIDDTSRWHQHAAAPVAFVYHDLDDYKLKIARIIASFPAGQ